jgi:hypothetical protein
VVFSSGREPADFLMFVYIYCLWRFNYQEGRFVIQLPKGEVCDPVIKRGGLGSNYHEGRFVIQLSRGEVCDPVTKRGGL